MTAVRSKKLKNVSNNGDLMFIHRGYANWKDASGNTCAFCKHESSSLHKQAVEVIIHCQEPHLMLVNYYQLRRSLIKSIYLRFPDCKILS